MNEPLLDTSFHLPELGCLTNKDCAVSQGWKPVAVMFPEIAEDGLVIMKLLLSGFARCPVCGSSIIKKNVRGKWFYYQCRGAVTRNGDTSCEHKKMYPASKMDTLVWNEVAAMLNDSERRTAGIEAYRQRQAGRATPLRLN